MTNDEVKATVHPERSDSQRNGAGGRWRGEILSITKRAHTRVIGRVETDRDDHYIEDTSHAWGDDLKISAEDVRSSGLKNTDWVQVEIISYPGSREGFRGKVIKVIGDMSDANTDNLRVLSEHQIPYEFSPQAIAESERIDHKISDAEIAKRKDLRAMDLVTIDGVTAKDFDDAIFVERTRAGFRLVVAIADVSHYVREGSLIDEEAYKKGTSTYYPGFVSPMLPEVLSNELCSLKPKVDRLCFVADMNFDHAGEKTSVQFYEAVMNSKARLTYGQAQEIIEGQRAEHPPAVVESVLLATDLAKILLAKRIKEGSLELEIPETYVEIDESGQPVDISKTHRLFAHRLIEEMMLAANVAVAEKFMASDIAAIYRIHDTPEDEAVMKLEKFLLRFGSRAKLSGGKLQKKLRSVLDEYSGKREETVLNILTLRSMKQAQYSAENRGHFGLGFANYTHFTSPIRRYPDLIVHRLLKALVTERGYKLIDGSRLATDGAFLSACEQRSVKSERQLISIKKARFMEKFTGQEFDGVVSSITKFGVFVLLKTYDVDGLIRMDELGTERFEYDEESLRLVGTRSGYAISIGDPIRVKVILTDPQSGRIDFSWINAQKSVDKREGNFKKDRSKPERFSKDRYSKDRSKKKSKKHGSRDKKIQSNSKHQKAEKDTERSGEPRVSGPDRKGKARSLFLKASYRSRS